jgi:hypothetical protein
VAAFRPLYLIRTKVGDCCHQFVALITGVKKDKPSTVWRTPAHRPVLGSLVRLMDWLGQKVRAIESGNYQAYCLYIMAALIILLLLNVAFI